MVHVDAVTVLKFDLQDQLGSQLLFQIEEAEALVAHLQQMAEVFNVKAMYAEEYRVLLEASGNYIAEAVEAHNLIGSTDSSNFDRLVQFTLTYANLEVCKYRLISFLSM